MKLSVGVFVALVGFWGIAEPLPAATKVFLMAGQSNMAGYETGLPDAPYDAVQKDVKIWNFTNDGWADLQPGFGNTSNDIGPEVAFGYALHNNIFPDDDIYLVKWAVNSTSLAGPWNPDGSGSAYNTFKSRVHAAMESLAGQSPKIAGMVWMQGETDANNAGDAAAYAANLTNLITAVRSDFAAPNMPFVVGRITDLSIYGFPGAADVRTAQETVPGLVGNASWINTDDLDMNPSAPGHYSAGGQIALGTRFAQEFTPVPEPSVGMLLGAALLAMSVYGFRIRRDIARRVCCAATFLFVACGVHGAWAADPLRIMCIGDSITAGNTNAPSWTVPYTFGYRGPLYTKLKAAGYDFQFVGDSGEPWNLPYGEDLGMPTDSVIQGPDLRELGQDNHRGYAGATTSQILNGGSAKDSSNSFPSIVEMMNADDPDIVLLMIGINGRQDAIDHIEALVNGIVTTKPEAKLIIAQITPRTSSYTPPINPYPPADIPAYNDYIKNVLMPKYPNDQYNVTMVDQYSGFILPDGTVDTSLLIDDFYVHLTPAGNERVAQVWFEGIRAVASVPEPSGISLLMGSMILPAGFACWVACGRCWRALIRLETVQDRMGSAKHV